MPTPGSQSYDVQRTRLRGRLETEGVNDKNADETANRIVQRDNQATPPGARDDRAAGPYGERTAGGDPGKVIGLRSPAFSDNTLLPSRCTREGVTARRRWSGTRRRRARWSWPCCARTSNAPDGPFLHWLVTGISPDTGGIDEAAAPAGAQEWTNDYGDTGYGGPRPLIGDDAHRYVFRLFALDAPLGLSPGAAVEDVRAELDRRRLATGTLIGLFVR